MRRIWMIAAILLLLPAALLLLPAAHAEENGLLGLWKTPVGATISIYHCNATLCAKLVGLSKNTPSRVDGNNPDANLRKRSLCGLEIGRGFHLDDINHADGGQLYDPKSGRTYSGTMVSDGNSMKLRGYIGIKLFGRTEVWTRVYGDVPACRP